MSVSDPGGVIGVVYRQNKELLEPVLRRPGRGKRAMKAAPGKKAEVQLANLTPVAGAPMYKIVPLQTTSLS